MSKKYQKGKMKFYKEDYENITAHIPIAMYRTVRYFSSQWVAEYGYSSTKSCKLKNYFMN